MFVNSPSRLTKPKQLSVSKIAIRRSICRESYYDFVKEFWGEIIGETPIWNWHIRIICNELQKVCERIFRNEEKEYDLLINVPPGSTKSSLCSIMLLPWIWTRFPHGRFLGGSYNYDLSLQFGNKARRLLRSKLYQETFPEIEISSDQDTKAYFTNTKKGERIATSTGASIIGVHFHLHVIDDPINPKGARSEVELREANLWLTESVAQRCVNLALTPLIMVMQRLSLEDPAGMMLDRRGGIPVRHICLPAEMSPDIKPPIFRNKYKKGLLDPVRLNPKILSIRKEELGAYGYAGQFEQRPVPLAGGMFKTEKLVGPKVSLAPTEFESVIRWWDKAASAGSGAYTAGVLMGRRKLKHNKRNPGDPPTFWVLDVYRKQVGSAEREADIRRVCEEDRALYGSSYRVGLEQEPGSGGKDSALATTWNLEGFSVVVEKATGKKEVRAEPFASAVDSENVAYVNGDWNKGYIEELQYFGELAKYKDQVDASSGAFNFLNRRRGKIGAGGFLWMFVSITMSLIMGLSC